MDNNEDITKILIEHLGTQYRLYREEVRSYLGFAAASASLLVLLLIGELTLSKNDPGPLLLIPLTVLSYGALLGFLYIHAMMAALYSELIELKMNELVGTHTFQFENYYVGPKTGRGEIFPFAVIWLLVGVMPFMLIGYGLWRLVQERILTPFMAHLSFSSVLLGLACILWSVSKITRSKKRMNTYLFEEWLKSYKVTHKDRLQ